MMIASIFLFGALALPFAGMAKQDYSHLTALAALYVVLTVVQGVYTVIEGSYIPIFMHSVGWFPDRRQFDDQTQNVIDAQNKGVWRKGFSVSVWGLVASNVGALVALLIGVVIQYTRGTSTTTGYYNYLLAITIAGCITSKWILCSARKC
jgi:MFS family permease